MKGHARRNRIRGSRRKVVKDDWHFAAIAKRKNRMTADKAGTARD